MTGKGVVGLSVAFILAYSVVTKLNTSFLFSAFSQFLPFHLQFCALFCFPPISPPLLLLLLSKLSYSNNACGRDPWRDGVTLLHCHLIYYIKFGACITSVYLINNLLSPLLLHWHFVLFFSLVLLAALTALLMAKGFSSSSSSYLFASTCVCSLPQWAFVCCVSVY